MTDPAQKSQQQNSPPRISLHIGRLLLKNPVLTASGTFGYGSEAAPQTDISLLGAIVGKSLTPEPRTGNEPPRLKETHCGLLNSIGLQNDGILHYIENILPRMLDLNDSVITSIAGACVEDYIFCAEKLRRTKTSGIEVNLSCPNVEKNGKTFAADPAMVYQVSRAVTAATPDCPIIVKLTPNTDRIVESALAAQEAGVDGLCVANTFLGMAVDIHQRRPVFRNRVAGYSGPAIKPLALRLVWDVCDAVRTPVIASGGIACLDDAMEFMMAGASAVQVGTASFVDPSRTTGLPRAISDFLKRYDIYDIQTIIGSAKEGSLG